MCCGCSDVHCIYMWYVQSQQIAHDNLFEFVYSLQTYTNTHTHHFPKKNISPSQFIRMRIDPTPPPFTRQGASTWTNNNPCAHHAKDMYLCVEKRQSVEICMNFALEYRKCMSLNNFLNKRRYERYLDNISDTRTAGFSINTWK